MTAEPVESPHYVYRLFDDRGVLLYVGSASDPRGRVAEHHRQPWWKWVDRREDSPAMCRDDALLAEEVAIRTEAPVFNHCHNTDGRSQRITYLRAREAHSAPAAGAVPDDGLFMRVPVAWVREVGLEAAAVFSLIAWRSERTGTWAASRRDLMAETGISDHKVRSALSRLREDGWLTSERVSAWDATQVWRPVWVTESQVRLRGGETSSRGGEDLPPEGECVPISSLETVETTTDPTADAVQEEAQVLDYAADEALPILVAVPSLPDQTPPRNAGTLVGRWVDGYRETNQGADPPTPLMKRVAGQMKRLARDCGEEVPAWSAAWSATYAAGRAGRPDAVPFMRLDTGPRYGRRNHDLENLQRMAAAGGPVSLGPVGDAAIAMLNPSSST